MALLRELSFLPLNSRDEFTTLRKFLAMEEFKSEHLAEELEIATHFLKEPEAAEIRDILMERAAVGDVKRAAAFYKIIRYSYGSGCSSYGCQPFDIRKTFTIIWEANRRLKDTVIENKDFEALIRQYDRPNAFFYCDPPYFETEGHYEVVFRKEDHVRLRDEKFFVPEKSGAGKGRRDAGRGRRACRVGQPFLRQDGGVCETGRASGKEKKKCHLNPCGYGHAAAALLMRTVRH